MLTLVDLRRVEYPGRHHAFTDLTRWRERWYLTFRCGESHGSEGGKVVLLRSDDFEKWEEAAIFSTGCDDRDPKLLATPERLIVYQVAFHDKTIKTPILHLTADGETWTGPQPAFQEGYVQWRARRGPDGRYYAAFHSWKKPGRLRTVLLCGSDDGLEWEEISPVWSSVNVNETDIAFTDDGELVALVRGAVGVRNQPSEKAVLAMSRPPYREWEYRDTDLSAGGPALATIRGTIYAAARRFRWTAGGERLPSVTTLYILQDRVLHQFLTLPSGGDCSYASFVDMGEGEVAMSYYSSHEGSTAVYVARLRQVPCAGGYGFLSGWDRQRTVDAKLQY